MRIPQDISHTDNTYRAMFSLLITIKSHNKKNKRKIKSVVCCGLGTYYGNMKSDNAAKLMGNKYKYIHY